ncbi:MAG TPA: hypothetical protein VK947_09420, partial [Planococcus sp. (in: firmicutes)]|nr:hypothetical protein [Planococcus sp. (in: firmicutes)]
TLHYRVVLIAQYCWRIAVRRRTIRFDLRKLISKLFVDVLLFSFQGSMIIALIGDFINISCFTSKVNTISKYFFGSCFKDMY